MTEAYGDWEPVIGLEIHAQLATRTKLFCGCRTSFGDPPNVHGCPVCLGLPGALPTLNAEAVRMAVTAALALGCTVHRRSVFARKHYVYPDLPKGYQITQYDAPLGTGGALELGAGAAGRTVGIERVHLEEDAGKNLHAVDGHTVVDLNRAGTPLIEIVGEPELHHPEQARATMRQLRDQLLFAGVCAGSLEQGSLRCDANVSVRRRGETELGTRVELKNINSFRFVAAALDVEIRRQIGLLEQGRPVRRQTRGYRPQERDTYRLRDKEGEDDYRYFPEPDLPPLVVDEALIAALQAQLPELPAAKRRRFVAALGLADEAAAVLCGHPRIAAFFEETALLSGQPVAAANLVQRQVLADVALDGLTATFPLSPRQLAGLVRLLARGALTGPQGRRIYAAMVGTEREADELVAELGLSVERDGDTLAAVARQVVAAHPDEAARYRGGKEGLLGFFMGQLMKATEGRADPELGRARLLAELDAPDGTGEGDETEAEP